MHKNLINYFLKLLNEVKPGPWKHKPYHLYTIEHVFTCHDIHIGIDTSFTQIKGINNEASGMLFEDYKFDLNNHEQVKEVIVAAFRSIDI